ncbi:hypothetical protein [Roseateles sp. BYS87W]|uniref:DUF1795 domain-containing protein n=1 Tax=Pelomonas baiyunensis TaxID=3299026 RepID=A0ABW7H2M3_9BURK
MRRHLFSCLGAAALLACALPLPTWAGAVATPFGSFNAPDGTEELSREQKVDARTGKPAGMVVLSRAPDTKAVYIVVWSYAEPDAAKPYDALDSAVKIGNPFDKSLTRDAAQAVQVGGVPGARYEGKLPNGLRAVSYVANNQGHRLVVLLKGPASGTAKDTADAIARGIEGFSWALPAAAAASAP